MDQNKELKKAGLKVTLPRLKILQILQEPANQHISAEDVYKILIDQGEEIGLATVYRVLNQFDDAGILNRHHFEGGKSVFEISHKEHHDHPHDSAPELIEMLQEPHSRFFELIELF